MAVKQDTVLGYFEMDYSVWRVSRLISFSLRFHFGESKQGGRKGTMEILAFSNERGEIRANLCPFFMYFLLASLDNLHLFIYLLKRNC